MQKETQKNYGCQNLETICEQLILIGFQCMFHVEMGTLIFFLKQYIASYNAFLYFIFIFLKLQPASEFTGRLEKPNFLGPRPGISDSVDPGQHLIICFSNQSPSDADTAGSGTTLWKPLSQFFINKCETSKNGSFKGIPQPL